MTIVSAAAGMCTFAMTVADADALAVGDYVAQIAVTSGGAIKSWPDAKQGPITVTVVEASSDNRDRADLTGLQKLAGGHVDAWRLFDRVCIMFAEEGRQRGLPTCALVDGIGDAVVGTCIIISAVGVRRPGSRVGLGHV